MVRVVSTEYLPDDDSDFIHGEASSSYDNFEVADQHFEDYLDNTTLPRERNRCGSVKRTASTNLNQSLLRTSKQVQNQKRKRRNRSSDNQ